jgi:hypothetical protein
MKEAYTKVTRSPVRVDRIPFALRTVVVGGLIVDAYVHAKLAGNYDIVEAGISEGNLFRLEAAVATVVAVLVLSGRVIWLVVAAVVAASAVAALLANTYLHVGSVGPLPDMYEPTWFAEKRFALIGESVAALGALAGLAYRERAVPVRKRLSGRGRRLPASRSSRRTEAHPPET